MKVQIQSWTMVRKRIRPSFNLGALNMLFSVSDKVSAPKLSDADRLDTAYPYRLEVVISGPVSGSYRLESLTPDAGELQSLLGRVWRTEQVKGKGRPVLVTDLSEYERLSWEEWVSSAKPTVTLTPA
ncbi:hypothetical protein MF271_14350 [Deinococcus sp. KNUC1210]|uniref:hypothetical protein n=1 Tax=Deinococcus sp. KNUC1210 TaxID=2917691 RepID=UPI001EF0766E|nr:hypothetical protein [Deinococcus sp. KNUC1210]ULH15122.1 hypothetical protein MF271_14350 [Deinococcus sp. KNUC1210]